MRTPPPLPCAELSLPCPGAARHDRAAPVPATAARWAGCTPDHVNVPAVAKAAESATLHSTSVVHRMSRVACAWVRGKSAKRWCSGVSQDAGSRRRCRLHVKQRTCSGLEAGIAHSTRFIRADKPRCQAARNETEFWFDGAEPEVLDKPRQWPFSGAAALEPYHRRPGSWDD